MSISPEDVIRFDLPEAEFNEAMTFGYHVLTHGPRGYDPLLLAEYSFCDGAAGQILSKNVGFATLEIPQFRNEISRLRRWRATSREKGHKQATPP